jgi:hypothetical protein
MIRIEKGREVRPGVFAWRVPQLGLEGRSHRPMSDACRRIQAILVDAQRLRNSCGGGRPSQHR